MKKLTFFLCILILFRVSFAECRMNITRKQVSRSVIPGGEIHEKIYLYNWGGDTDTHVTVEIQEGDLNASFDPPERDVFYTVDTEGFGFSRNIMLEPRNASENAISDDYIEMPGQEGKYIQTKILEMESEIPEEAVSGEYYFLDLELSGVCFYLDEQGVPDYKNVKKQVEFTFSVKESLDLHETCYGTGYCGSGLVCKDNECLSDLHGFCQTDDDCYDGLCKDNECKLANGESCEQDNQCYSNICGNSICREPCDGCFLYNWTCVDYGARDQNNYCNQTGQIVSQKEIGSECQNNYECSSNFCPKGECIADNIFSKFVLWLKNIFGF